MTQARRHLLSWVRDGLAGRITQEEPGQGPVPVRARLTTELTLNGVVVPGPTLALHGPGEVVGLDPRQVIRTDPAPGATAFEHSHLALVEFDDPGLPWRLTPLAPHAERGLRPWLVLVVVDMGVAGVQLRTDARRSLPVLECPLSELPDLARSASWAHAEVAAVEGEDIAHLLAERPERTVSRLLAPRRLAENRSYLACVVPAFEHARLAGLGLPLPAGDTSAPAWSGRSGTAALPVYHHWRFSTGPAGDFPTLAQRLRPAVVEPGWKNLFYKAADPELTEALGDDPGLVGLLPALTLPGLEQGTEVHPGYAHGMATILGRAGAGVTPPFYLAAHVGHGPAWNFTEPPWLRQLNVDPRLRAAAGLGVEVVRTHQEALMASAWRQAAALEQVNGELRQGRLGRAVSESLHRRHFSPSGPPGVRSFSAAALAEQADVVVQRAATAFRRIPTEDGTLATELETHESTSSTASTDVQRAARPTGPAARAAGASATDPLPSAVTAVATAALVPAPPVAATSDAGVLDRYTGERTAYRDITRALVEAATPWWRASAAFSQALVTPGPVGYLTDLVVIQETAAPSVRSAPPPVTQAALLRGIDFDGRPTTGGPLLPVAGDTAAPTVRVAGGLVSRGQHPGPTILQAGIRPTIFQGVWEPCIRWVPLSPDGLPQPGPYLPLPTNMGAARGADILLRRRPQQTDAAAELVLAWTGYSAEGHHGNWVRSYRLDTREALGPARALPIFWHSACDAAVDVVPVPSAAGQPYSEPRDVVFAVAYPTGHYDGMRSYFWWGVQWWVGRAFGTAQESWSEPRWVVIGDRVYNDETGAHLGLSVTDLDGDGQPDLVVHLTFDEPQQSGPARRVLRQKVGHGLRPDGTVSEWDAGHNLPVPPLPGVAETICFLGDLDETRPDRLRQLGDRFQMAAAGHQGRLIRPVTEGSTPSPAAYQVSEVAGQASGALDPAATIPAAVSDRITLGDEPLPQPSSALADGSPPDPLRPRLYEPIFPQAMSEPIRDLFPELVFPAADTLPDDRVALLGGNSALIAAYLAGVNHEFGRELLWRGFPSSGRATWFRRFFDARVVDPSVEAADILDIAAWGDHGDLADKTTGPASDDSVIVIVRAELLRRYPNLTVQAARAVSTPEGRQPAAEVLLPTFTGRAGADVSLFSFAIPEGQVRGGGDDPGWFFLFAEPPTEPRFAASADPSWTAPGAHAAAALLRLPFRIAVHASDLLAPL